MQAFANKKIRTARTKGKLICTAGHIHAYNADAEWLLASKDRKLDFTSSFLFPIPQYAQNV